MILTDEWIHIYSEKKKLKKQEILLKEVNDSEHINTKYY